MKVVIIGGGPAGLAAGGALKQKGIPNTLLEQGDKVGTSWQGHYDRLHLHTIRRLSGLPGYPIPDEMGKWVARDDLVRYLEEYAKRFELDIRLGTNVLCVERSDGRWRVKTEEGDHTADRVVMATGYNRTPVIPDWPGKDEFEGELIHSAQYRNATGYKGKRVLVAGSGNSGAEIAADLASCGAKEVLLAVRPHPHLPPRRFLVLAPPPVPVPPAFPSPRERP